MTIFKFFDLFFMSSYSLSEAIKAVETFHNSFGISNASIPETIDLKTALLRYKLMREENEEYLKAAEEEDLVEIADALGDMLYILCGTILKHGLQEKIVEVFKEIQRSNMSKLGADGKPLYRVDGKVLKGENYFSPNIEKILKM